MLEVDIAMSVLRKHLIVFFTGEGRFSQCNHVKDHTETEQVANRFIAGLQILEVDYFRSHITWRSTSHKHVVFLAVLSQPEVSNHAIEISIFPQQDVLRFEVAVHDVVLMYNFKSFKNALHYSFGLMRGEFMLGLYLVVQLPAFEQLHAYVN